MATTNVQYTTSQPYLAVFIVLRRNNKIAFVMRSNTAWMNGYYGLPSGKVEVGERALTAAVREAKEEVGITILEEDLKFIHTSHRHAEDYTLAWIDLVYEASHWAGEPHNAEPHKHSELAWLDPDNLPDNVLPSIRFEIEQINQGSIYSEFGWEATDVMAKVQQAGFDRALLVGGAETNSAFARAGSIDEMILDVHPLVLGDGKRLLGDYIKPLNLKLISSQTNPKGFIQNHYQIISA